MPGTVIDMSDNIVRKDMSFIEPQRRFDETDVRPLRATLVGITANPKTKPSGSKILPHILYKFI
jgi:hypothetical protein